MSKRHIKKKAHFSGRGVDATRRVCPEITRQVDLGQGQTDSRVKNKASKFALPDPIELAKLAAILRPSSGAKAALEAAMQFYVEAVLLCGELPSTLEELVVRFGSDERREEVQIQALRAIRDSDDKLVPPVKKLLPEKWKETIELQLTPAVHEDAARQYLSEQGWDGGLKNPGTVLTNIRRYWRNLPKYGIGDLLDSADQFVAKQIRIQNGRKICDLPRLLLENMVELRKRTRRGSKLTSYHAHKGKARLRKSGKKNLQKSSV